MKCNQCNESATVNIEYGTYQSINEFNREPQNVNLCRNHAKGLWEKCAPIVNSGQMHWFNWDITVS